MGMPFEDPDMQEIFEGFLVETQELLDSVSQDLMVLENQPDDLDLLNQIFRSFHTIKGTSSFMGFEDITEITHHAEDLLNKLRRSELKVNQPIIDVLLEVHDWIEVLIEKIQTGDTEPPDFHDTINVIDTLARGEMPDEAEPAQSVQSAPEEQPETETTAEDDTQKPDTTPPSASAVDAVLGNPEIGSGEGDFSDEELALLDAAFAEVNQSFHKGRKEEEPEDADISDTDEPAPKADVPDKDDIVSDLPDKAEKSEPKKPVPPPTKPDAHAPGTAKKPKVTSETIRVDVARVESLMDLSGELVLGRNRLAQLTEQLENKAENKESVRDFIENTAQIDFVTSEIQAAVMRMRMVPVGKLYQKAPRIVRDLSREFKKQIKLVVKGEETEIDRGIIEELNDPLVHMIRNSCDHGIESPQDRMEKGKPAQGTITLDAEQEGNNIVLKISDDGQGMDPEKIKSKAIEKGIITEEQASQMSSREAYQLIFMPGFSTAQKVSNVSGRGVGMDVVRTNIQNLKGMIEIESAPGKGSTFIIKLPLTLAIIQGLL
ncbi:MAG: chemotaxis protein CheA, partial [Candidatus Kapaibacterium sp.]